MTPDRKITIAGSRVEEFYWAGKYVVYVNNNLVDEGFDDAVKRLVAAESARTDGALQQA